MTMMIVLDAGRRLECPGVLVIRISNGCLCHETGADGWMRHSFLQSVDLDGGGTRATGLSNTA